MGVNLLQYGLGLFGVNRVKNPLALQDGEVTAGGNAALSMTRARAAICKRRGLGLLLEGSGDPLLAVLPIPFDDFHPGDPLPSPSSPYPPFPPRLARAPYVGPTPSLTTPFSITICWEPLLGADFYKLFLSTVADFSSFVPGFEGLVVNEESCCHECAGLDPSTIYYYYLQGWNVRGPSPDSDPGEGKTDDLPPPPSTGTWEIPLASTSGTWPEALAVFLGSDPAAAAVTNFNQSLVAAFDANLISLNGDAPRLASGLPAGFTITSASGWFGTYKVGPSSYGGFQVWLKAFGSRFALINVSGMGYPASAIAAIPGPLTMARLLGLELTMELVDLYNIEDGNKDTALGASGPQIHLYGNYSISG
jgi:hypothetical protein